LSYLGTVISVTPQSHPAVTPGVGVLVIMYTFWMTTLLPVKQPDKPPTFNAGLVCLRQRTPDFRGLGLPYLEIISLNLSGQSLV